MKVSQKGIIFNGTCRIAAAFAAFACAASVCAAGTLPAGYTRVVGIQSAGLSGNSPYIDLGYKPTQNTRVDINFELLDWGCGQSGAALDNYPCPFGACHANNALAFTMTGGGSTTDGPCWSYRWGNGSAVTIISWAIVEGPHRLEANGPSWTMDGLTKEKTGGSSETFTLTQSLYVFARNNNGTMDHPVYMTLYGFDIYESGVLRHSFVPCVRDADGEPGLYDTVGDKGFLVKSGTGAFTVVRSYLEIEGVPRVFCDSFWGSPRPVVHPFGDSSTVLDENADYTLSYGRRTSSDGYRFGWIQATGIGNCAGVDSRKIWFRIVDDATDAFSVGQIAPVAYKNGEPCTPRPVVRTADESRTLVEGTDYDLSWGNNCEIGRGYVLITGKGVFADKLLVESFSILPVLPGGYKAVEWIRSSGTQYIDTGFKPDLTTRADYHFNMETKPTVWEQTFGSRQSSSAQKFYIIWNKDKINSDRSRGVWSCHVGDSSAWEPDSPAFLRGAFLGEHFFSINKTTFILDGYLRNTVSATAFEKTHNAYIFAINQNGRPLNNSGQYGKFKLYSLKIWDNGTLVREFVPCVNKDGEAGLYDITPGAEKKFYANDGTGEFETGPELVARTGFAVYVH